MGAAIVGVKKELEAVDNEQIKMAKENLTQLEESAKLIADGFRLGVINLLKNPIEANKWQVVGGRQDREDLFIGVSSKTTPSHEITAGVESLIKGLFNIAGPDKDERNKAFQTSVSSMVEGAFNVFLGNTAAGSSTQKKFLIIPHSVCFYRIDICMYKYTLESKGFTDHYESQTVVYTSRAILDVKELHASELLAYVSEINAGDNESIKKWFENFKTLYRMAREVIKDASEELPISYSSYKAVKPMPPSIAAPSSETFSFLESATANY